MTQISHISSRLRLSLLGLILSLPLYAQNLEPVVGERIDIDMPEVVEQGEELGGDTSTMSYQVPTINDTTTSHSDSPSPSADTLHGTIDYPRYTPEEYQYAKGPRYTLIGDLPYRETHLKPGPAIVTGLAVTGAILGIHFYQQDAWWSDRREPFHFSTDWGYAMQSDKLGHFFAGYFTSYIGYEALVASGVSPDVAGWFGPVLGLGFQTYVEIEDGFSPFGFDPTDQYANTLGPLLFSLQHYIPVLQNAKFKFSYWPNDEYDQGVRDGHEEIIIDDYNGQTMWFSLKMGNILPESLGWPKWLRLAGGYGAYNVDRFDVQDRLLQPGRRFFIALDYDLVELMPDLGTFGNWIVQTADYLRFPAPALQLEPEVKFYLAWPIVF